MPISPWPTAPAGSGCGGDASTTTATQELDNAHLMRMAGRFSRRVRAWAVANRVPVIDCKTGERKHLLAEAYLAGHPTATGVFLNLGRWRRRTIAGIKASWEHTEVSGHYPAGLRARRGRASHGHWF